MKRIVPIFLLLLAASPAWAAEVEHAPVTPFAGTIAQSVAAILVFLLLLAVLYKLAWGPILQGLQDREAKIRGDLEHAERSAKGAAETLEQYRKELSGAHEQARQILEKARLDAERVAADLREQTQKELSQTRERFQREVQSAKEQAISDLHAQAATLATMVAGRILQRELNVQDQQRLVDESLAGLGSARSN